MADQHDDDGMDGRNAGVVAFLGYLMTPAEAAMPRMQPVLRPVPDVPIGELRVHPDLVDRLRSLEPAGAPSQCRMLMGAAVLVADSGVIYALAYSQRFLALRLDASVDAPLVAALQQTAEPTSRDDARSRQPAARTDALGAGWILVEPWAGPSLELLQHAVAQARTQAQARDAN